MPTDDVSASLEFALLNKWTEMYHRALCLKWMPDHMHADGRLINAISMAVPDQEKEHFVSESLGLWTKNIPEFQRLLNGTPAPGADGLKLKKLRLCFRPGLSHTLKLMAEEETEGFMYTALEITSFDYGRLSLLAERLRDQFSEMTRPPIATEQGRIYNL